MPNAPVNTLTVGSTELFQLIATLDGNVWNITGGTVTLILADPNGNETSITASSVYDGGAQAPWMVLNTPGVWKRAWKVVAGGITQYSEPITFTVVSSPI